MALVFDMLMFQITRDIERALMVSASNATPPKPRTIALLSFAIHAKRIMYFTNHSNAWGRTTASTLADAVTENRLAIHQPSPYRTRVVVFAEKCWFIDLYFSSNVITSETWFRKMKALLEETRQNGGSMCRTLQSQFYPGLPTEYTFPAVNGKTLARKPFWDDT